MNYYVLKSIEFGPTVFERLVSKIDPSHSDTHPDAERFSIRELVAHLADWEPIFRGRMELILSEPGVHIAGQDESERAVRNRYDQQDIAENLAKFRAERAKTVRFLKALDLEDFQLQGVRDEYGPMSIEDFANLLVCHDMYHVEQLTEYL